MADTFLTLYYRYFKFAYSIAHKYSYGYLTVYQDEFIEAANEGLIIGVRKYIRLHNNRPMQFIKWAVLDACQRVARSLLNVNPQHAKMQFYKYNIPAPAFYPQPPEFFNNLNLKDKDNFYEDIYKKEVLAILRQFAPMDLDSVKYYWKEFHLRYPHVTRKSHDNLRTRTLVRIKQAYELFDELGQNVIIKHKGIDRKQPVMNYTPPIPLHGKEHPLFGRKKMSANFGKNYKNRTDMVKQRNEHIRQLRRDGNYGN